MNRKIAKNFELEVLGQAKGSFGLNRFFMKQANFEKRSFAYEAKVASKPGQGPLSKGAPLIEDLDDEFDRNKILIEHKNSEIVQDNDGDE